MSKLACLFPGQGAQHVGMGKTIVERSPAARRLFDQAREILGYDLAELCFEGPQTQLDKTDISQPAIYVTSLACLEILRAENPEILETCTAAAGLSLGEYTALVFAGAMTFEDGLRVVQKRGQAMQAAAEATPSGMVSILLLDPEKVAALCQSASDAGTIQIANLLCPGNTVVSGTKAACEKIISLTEPAGGRAIALSVAGAGAAYRILYATRWGDFARATNSRLFECRCATPQRSRRDQGHPRQTGVKPGTLGRFDAGLTRHRD